MKTLTESMLTSIVTTLRRVDRRRARVNRVSTGGVCAAVAGLIAGCAQLRIAAEPGKIQAHLTEDDIAETPRAKLVPLLVLTLVLTHAGLAYAKDTLGDFEDAVKDAAKGGSKGGDYGRDHRHDSDDHYVDDPYHRDRDVEPSDKGGVQSATLRHYTNRSLGAPAAAAIRLESSYQRLNTGDVDGYTLRGEIFYRSLGLGGEFISYREGSPKQKLNFESVEVLFRFTPSKLTRITAAVGTRVIDGRSETPFFEGGISFGLYPIDPFGVEVDLRWAYLDEDVLGDYRIGALLRHPSFPFVALRGGYRLIQVRGDSLHGGEVGVVLTW